MTYLESFSIPGRSREEDLLTGDKYGRHTHLVDMACFDGNNVYPFKIFPEKEVRALSFDPITIFYGGNGSGKSTLLNIIAEKLQLRRSAPFNKTPYFEEYLRLCTFETARGGRIPGDSLIITSDDVFDFLLDLRAINQGIDDRRASLIAEYDRLSDPNHHFQMQNLEQYDLLKQKNDARSKTKSAYVAERMASREVKGLSNGESAYLYFTDKIKEKALYLLDEPENSLSPRLQMKLMDFIEDSARFYNCQFIISSHSPFLLSLRGARIYDLDSRPVKTRHWTTLENPRLYYDFFKKHQAEFEKEH